MRGRDVFRISEKQCRHIQLCASGSIIFVVEGATWNLVLLKATSTSTPQLMCGQRLVGAEQSTKPKHIGRHGRTWQAWQEGRGQDKDFLFSGSVSSKAVAEAFGFLDLFVELPEDVTLWGA